MKKIIFTLLLSFTFLCTTQAQYDPKAASILDAMSKKYKQMTAFKADFKYTLSSDVEKINESFSGSITVKGDKFKLQMDGQEIYNDETTVWTYLKDANEVTITNNDPEENEITPAKIYDMYKKGYKYLYLEEKTIGGKACDVVDLVPEDKSMDVFKVRLMIDKQDKILRSWQVFEKKGRRYEFTITALNSKIDVKDSFFRFDKAKYPNVAVVELR